MKRIVIFCSVIIIAGFFSCVTPAVQPTIENEIVIQEVITGSSVWKVSRGSNIMYLGGSIHILRESDFPLPDEFDLALSQSDILVLEADIEQMEDEHIVMYLMSQMFLPDNVSLRTILDSETYGMLSAALMEYGFPIEFADNLKPSMVMNILLSLHLESLGYEQQGVDVYYLLKAKNENIPVTYLETLESQIDMLVSMGDGYENEYVKYTLQDMDNTEAGLEELLSGWRNGIAAGTEEMLIDMMVHWPSIYKALITDRHEAWIPQIYEFLDSGKVYFVIAGLAHMHGPDGLLLHLKNSGYTVEKL